ncbi:MAG: SCO family protein [Flavobacteriales bacterium]|nr:SCO family protein [Flavobacteriales bacterium]
MTKYKWIILAFIAIWVIGMMFAYPMLKKSQRLQVFQPSDVNPQLVDTDMQRTAKAHRIADFSLTDQTGHTVTNKDFENKIYVADFFFTTCPSICPKMTASLSDLSKFYAADEDIMFLSHSVTPEKDSVPVLAAYAVKYEVNPEKWKLVTGDKKHIYELARRSYFAVTTEGDGGASDFIHTENFILVDKERKIRGFYDGTSSKDMERLKNDITILRYEYEE